MKVQSVNRDMLCNFISFVMNPIQMQKSFDNFPEQFPKSQVSSLLVAETYC